MTELRLFLGMLDNTGTGYGTRHDSNPDETAVLLETGEDESDFYITTFHFNKDGTLNRVTGVKGEIG